MVDYTREELKQLLVKAEKDTQSFGFLPRTNKLRMKFNKENESSGSKYPEKTIDSITYKYVIHDYSDDSTIAELKECLRKQKNEIMRLYTLNVKTCDDLNYKIGNIKYGSDSDSD